MNIAALERDVEKKKNEGKALAASVAKAAEAENRVLTDDERTQLAAIKTDVDGLMAKIAQAKGDSTQLEEFTSLMKSAGTGITPAAAAARSKGPQSMGRQFVSAEGYDFFRKGLHRGSAQWHSPSMELFDHQGLHAATLTSDPASGGALVVPDYQPGILQTPTRRLVVADLLASGTTDSNLIAYMQETAFTNAAAAVLEGAAKPESALTFAAVNDPVRKIAHWLPVSEEMLEDVAQIQSYIDARLRLGVQLAEEDELLNGTGVAPHILGILKRPGLAPAIARGAAESNMDAIFRQIMTIYGASLLMPDGVVMNPADWATTVLSKNVSGDYYTGGPFSPIQSPTMWGLPVAVTPAIVAATALVGAFKSAAQVFRKGGIRVEASNSHQDFFVKNLVAIRAEERLALAVYRPGAFGTVTGLGVPVLAALGAGDLGGARRDNA
jgi:HK97 family phage major capsid protein